MKRKPPREQPHRERRNRIAATFATADMVGNSQSPMAGFAFGDPRHSNMGVSPRAGLLTKPAGAWSVATIKVRGSTAGRLRKAPAVTREVRFRRDVGIWSALRNRQTLAPKRTRAAGRTGGSR